MKRTHFITKDGSSTIYANELNEHYHSTHGAITESLHIFLKTGFEKLKKEEAKIFEVGFGTGLNAFLTLQYARKTGKKINYHSIEKYPLEKTEYEKLNYYKNNADMEKEFIYFHELNWKVETKIDNFFSLKKINGDLTKYAFTNTYDLVYFDAFSPKVQPEMWTSEIFEKIYKNMNQGALLVTYSAKGSVKRCLQKTGFTVTAPEGPPGKKEITLALKD